jgi:hypothetical protein
MPIKPNPAETGALLNKVAKSASWWRPFFDSQGAGEIHRIIDGLSPLEMAALDQRARSYAEYGYYRLHNSENLRPSASIRSARNSVSAKPRW